MRITEEDFERYVDFIGEQESQELMSPDHFVDKVASIADYGEYQLGDDLPWHYGSEVWKLRPSELTVWAGINGHGKSLLNGQVMLNEMKSKKVVIASLEMLPEQTLYRMACQFAGCRPSGDFARKVIHSMENRCWLYDQQTTIDSIRILGMVLYCAKELKADHIVIDSLLKCGIPEDDFKRQKDFVDKLQWIAKSNRSHIHLIAHMRKRESEYQVAGKLDIRGTGAISDLADNVLVISRNKLKESLIDKQKEGEELTKNEQDIIDKARDATLSIHKNRHGQKEGKIKLYFDNKSMQYTESQRLLPEPWKID